MSRSIKSRPLQRIEPIPRDMEASNLPCSSAMRIYGFQYSAREIVKDCVQNGQIRKEWLPIGLLVNQEEIMRAIDPQKQAEKSKEAAAAIDSALLSVNAAGEVVNAAAPILEKLEELNGHCASLDKRLGAIEYRLEALESKGGCIIC